MAKYLPSHDISPLLTVNPNVMPEVPDLWFFRELPDALPPLIARMGRGPEQLAGFLWTLAAESLKRDGRPADELAQAFDGGHLEVVANVFEDGTEQELALSPSRLKVVDEVIANASVTATPQHARLLVADRKLQLAYQSQQNVANATYQYDPETRRYIPSGLSWQVFHGNANVTAEGHMINLGGKPSFAEMATLEPLRAVDNLAGLRYLNAAEEKLTSVLTLPFPTYVEVHYYAPVPL
jgi:hypothetical protein